MRFPSGIDQKNKTIGFAAPSFGCATEPYRTAFDNALDKWHRAGYRTFIGPNCYASEGIGISSTPEKCGRELTEMYCSDECDAIISCGGGELMCEILDHVDFDAVGKAAPKWFMGYSDNTNFTFTLTTMCDVASIYGPCAASFGQAEDHRSQKDAFSILTDAGPEFSFHGYGRWESEGLRDEDHPLAGFNLNEETHLRRLDMSADIYRGDIKEEPGNAGAEEPRGTEMEEPAGAADASCGPLTSKADIIFAAHGFREPEHLEMKGRLIGGCLDCLVNLCGTEYDHVSQFNEKYRKDGILWYLESCDLNVFSMRRALWELKSAGWFEAASGFVIGRPLHFAEEMMGLDQYSAVLDLLGQYRVPVLMDADIGHLSPMVPLINGSLARITADGNDWAVHMQLD